MDYQTRSLITIFVMMVIIIGLSIRGYIPYDEYSHRQIETFAKINAKQQIHFGYIQPQVVDGFNEKPIEGARIVIPELNKKFITNAEGFTSSIKVPIIEDTHYKNICPKPWGEVTLIVYKEGYMDYVLFHTHIWENQTRQGPKILLFPTPSGERNQPMAIVESPHRLWTTELVEKYRH